MTVRYNMNLQININGDTSYEHFAIFLLCLFLYIECSHENSYLKTTDVNQMR